MDIDKLQQQLAAYLAQGYYDEASDLCEQGINTEPAITLNYWYLGIAMLLQGEESEAQAIWLSAITQVTPDEMDAVTAELLQVLQTAALQFLDNREFQKSEIIYWQILELDSNDCTVYYNLGNALAQQGNFDEAINCWQNAIALKPDYVEAYEEWGSVCHKLEDFESAIACYSKALELKPDNYQTAYNLGLCFSFLGMVSEASACFQNAIQLKPDSTQPYGDLGYLLLQKGQLDDAIKLFNQAIPVSFLESYCRFIDTLKNQSQSKEVFNDNACFLKYLHLHPYSFDTFLYLAKIIDRTDTLSAIAREIYQKALEFNPDADIIVSRQNKLDNSTKASQEILSFEPPKYFYESTLDWANTYNIDKHYLNIYPNNTLYLTPPKTPDTAIHFSFRFGSQVELPATFVAIVPDGRFWLNKKQDKSAVIAADNKLLGDISPDFPVLSPGHPDKHPSKHSIFSVGKLPPIQRIDGTVAVLAGLLNDTYFHWMFDILPRIELLDKSGIDIATIDKFLVSSRLSFQKETLKALGIPETKILETDEYPHIQATSLVVPSFPSSLAWMPKWACNFLRQEFLHKKTIETEKIERIYISRKPAPNRRIINEDEIVSCLTKYGFRSVILESMSVVEQAALLAHAKVVVAPHGGGLTNTVFCNPGTKVIEIFSPNYVYPCYWLISNQIGLAYYYLQGENPEGFYLHKLLYPDARLEDIFVNINELLKIMRFAGAI
ncbi:glycosyltransferase 61 family protein [Microseira wollei]|uniref:TPR domain protein n=1 Tax=Microseira wollei NIES-4236 TaxID=2530354 RepID=A0AAV3XKF2_9CYAN|nr:glycosyltransferase 61 family protein [Microseira wollei]GET42081.1 TPR domain protein [Microseira wollei NIES-4236]